MKKPKALIISSLSPLITDSGGATRIHFTLINQSKYFDIYFIFFIPQNYKLTVKDKQFLGKYTRYYLPLEISGWKKLTSFVDDFQPYWFSDWMKNELKIFIPELIRKHDIKFVQIECTQLSYLVPYIPANVKKVLVAYDISTVSFFRRFKEIPVSIHKLFHFESFIEIYLYERKYLPLYDYVVVVSEIDKMYLKKYFKKAKALVVPNGIESLALKQSVNNSLNRIKIGYIGSFSHPPNRTAIEFFLNKLANQLTERNINYEYLLAGSIDISELEYYIKKAKIKKPKSIKALGFVDNYHDFFESIDVLVAPIFSGSGTRIKIVEALSCGAPVITTSIGAEGLESIKSKYLTIANDEKKFLDEIINGQWRSLDEVDQKKLKLIMGNYLWSTIFENYCGFVIKNILSKV